MLSDPPRFCLSLDAGTVEAARHAVRDLPPVVDLIELRLDRCRPEEVSGGDWAALAGEEGREWVLTWRSPREGGTHPRPSGVLERALESGFAWIDVEATSLEEGDPASVAVPPARRWVSHHQLQPPRTASEVGDAWRVLARQEGALHKLVVPVEDFAANDWILEVQREAARTGPVSVFGMGWTGHPSRILGALEGNAVTFLAREVGGETAPGQPDLELALGVYRLGGFPAPPSLYGVLGHPVQDSRSPHLHNHAFRTQGLPALYLLLDTPSPKGVLDWVRRGRLQGVSVTSPFKEVVVPELDRLEPAAKRIGAVNTVWREDGFLVGANTDAEAAAQMLARLPSGDMAVLGAGGGARAMVEAARMGGRSATMFHRSLERGRRVAAATRATWGGSWSELDAERFAVVVNATPVGGTIPIPAAMLDRRWWGGAFLDLNYGKGPCGWETWVREGGGEYHGGLEFLARQAVGQQRRWTGTDVPLSLFLGEGGV